MKLNRVELDPIDKVVERVGLDLRVEYRNGSRWIEYKNELRVNVSTRAGRMAARAYALTYRAEEPNELRGEEVYNEIIKLIGESE